MGLEHLWPSPQSLVPFLVAWVRFSITLFLILAVFSPLEFDSYFQKASVPNWPAVALTAISDIKIHVTVSTEENLHILCHRGEPHGFLHVLEETLHTENFASASSSYFFHSHGNKEVFSCWGIRLAVDWFRERGHTYIKVFVPLWRKEPPRQDSPIAGRSPSWA